MAQNSRWPARFLNHEYPQIIPEPDEIRAGELPPWAALDESARQGLGLDIVLARLHEAQRTFEEHAIPDQPRELAQVHDDVAREVNRSSAVLVALFEEDGETRVVLTRRSQSLRHHRGEIAFPGGRSDEGETPVHTALREASEEVGIDSSLVTPVGWLSPIVTFASGSAIWPVIGTLLESPTLVVDPVEVDRAFSVSLRELLADDAFLEERWRRAQPRPGVDGEGFFPIYFYRVPGDVIWGATARILTELLCVVTQVNWPEAERVWA
jgi:8-oxo-dGTP pyrophosphatase MutT (NUDIX family)